VRRFFSGTGRVLITVGLLILLFVGYELWGTNVIAARAQNELKGDLCTTLERSGTVCDSDLAHSRTSQGLGRTTGNRTRKVDLSNLPAFQLGDALGRIQIPDAGVDKVFVEGTDREYLNLGPGHYPGTPLPGQRGVAAIAGHRTTHGAPFYNLNEVHVKDDPAITDPNNPEKLGSFIWIQDVLGTFVYEVIEERIVQPTETWVAAPVDAPIDTAHPQTRTNWMTELGDGRREKLARGEASPPPIKLNPKGAYLTLTSCNPRFSARERLVVFARLYKGIPAEVTLPKGQQLDSLPGEKKTDPFAGDPAARVPAGAWGIGALLLGMAWWWAYRRWRHPATWMAGVVPFLAVVSVSFFYLERALPSGY
jgi:sortase A